MTLINHKKLQNGTGEQMQFKSKIGVWLVGEAKGLGGEADHQNRESHENKQHFLSLTKQQSRWPGLPFHPY